MYNIIQKKYPNGDIQYKIYDKVMFTSQDEVVKIKKECNYEEYQELRELYYNDVCNVEIAKKFENLQKKLIQKEKIKELTKVETSEQHKLKVRLNNDKRDKQKIYDIARSNEWHYFGTFTFSSEKVNRYDYDECYKKLSKWLMNIKNRKCNELKYLCVPEQHTDGAWHFHCLLANCDELEFVPAINNNKDSKYYGLPLLDNIGNEIYNIKDYKIGYTNFSRVRDTRRISMYITKYITKGNCIKLENRNRHLSSRNLDKPKVNRMLYDDVQLHELYSTIQENIKWQKTKKIAEYTDYENEITYIEL